jgi:DNA-binding protein HU-beta
MKKIDFVKEVSKKAGVSIKDAESVVNSSLETITDILERSESITFMGFGTFETVVRASRETTLPTTKERVRIPAKMSVKFKTGKNLKEKVAAIPVEQETAEAGTKPSSDTTKQTAPAKKPVVKKPAPKKPAQKTKKRR